MTILHLVALCVYGFIAIGLAIAFICLIAAWRHITDRKDEISSSGDV